MAKEFDASDVEYYIDEINKLLNENTELTAEPISVPEDQITPAIAETLGANLQKIYFTLRKQADAAYEEKQKQQRYERGWADEDVWDIPDWMIRTLKPMLEKLADEHLGYQMLDENGDFVYPDHRMTTEKSVDIYDKRWTDTLKHMAFLLGEMDEETCSFPTPKYEAWCEMYEKYEEQYVDGGECLKSEENQKIIKEMLQEDKEKELYREKCKNEFFKLFSKYFFALCD